MDVTGVRRSPVPAGAGAVVVLTDVDPAHDDEFNAWYDDEHVPERAVLPGVARVRRYRRREDREPAPGAERLELSGAPEYLVIYELDDVGVLDREWAELVAGEPSERSLRMYAAMRGTQRQVYDLIGEFAGGEPGDDARRSSPSGSAAVVDDAPAVELAAGFEAIADAGPSGAPAI